MHGRRHASGPHGLYGPHGPHGTFKGTWNRPGPCLHAAPHLTHAAPHTHRPVGRPPSPQTDRGRRSNLEVT